MNCKICKTELTGKSKILCNICTNKRHKISCEKCGKECEISAGYVRRIDLVTFNCKQCKFKGEDNPNYGKKWTQEKKELQSQIIKTKVDDDYREKCSKGMKGKEVSDDTKLKRKKTLEEKKRNGYVKPEMSDETKLKIGLKSSAKFTKEYKRRIREINEERGVWIKIEDKKDYHFYRNISNWVGQVINENTKGYERLKNNTFYSKKNRDKNTLVRDHMFGRKNGFFNEVFPEIIRHPANCQLITHSENIKKSLSADDSEITINELFDKIMSWDNFYFEHELCLRLIDDYKNGLRYSKENYIYKVKNYEF